MTALWTTQFVQGRTADSHRTATRALSLADPESELGGQAHFAVGGSAVSLGMPAEGLSHLELAAKLASVTVRRRSPDGVTPRARTERCANAAVHTFGCASNGNHAPEGNDTVPRDAVGP
jgi:hypothetical protein